MEFPKLKDTAFPNLETVDVYAFKNDYDYKRFDNAQMTIHVLNVPWDMGEAHVGQRTITGIGNVVKFEDDAERDAWFDSKRYAETPEQWASGGYDGFKWVTKYRRFHNGDDMKIPLPFDVVARFNYAYITYSPAPSLENPVDWEEHGLLKWFMFIRNFQMSSVNSTSCTVKRDTWQTYINHIQFQGFMLEQGHYPVALSDVDRYLADPVNNNSGLLEEDAVFGDLSRVVHSDSVVLNGSDMLAVMVSSSNPLGNWGDKASNTWRTPNGFRMQDGQPSYWAFCMAASDISAFMANMESQSPQFAQTVKAVFFVSSQLVQVGSAFEFCGIQCNRIAQKNSNLELIDLEKSQFGFPSRYAHLAKLYTYPYSALEVTDQDGNASLVRIEDTSGTLLLRTSVNMAFPWVNVDGRLDGVGGGSVKTLTFRNVSSHSFSFSGRWYEHIVKWEIPTFAITQSASYTNDYATHFDRLQSANDAATSLADQLAVNATEKANADATADMSVTNTEVQNAANLSNVIAQADALSHSNEQDIYANNAGKNIANTVTEETANNQKQAEYDSAAISSISSLAGGAINGAAAGASMGPQAMAAGAVAGLAAGTIGAIATNMQAAVSNNLTDAQARVQKGANDAQNGVANGVSNQKLEIQTDLNSDSVRINNDNNTAQTANNAGLMKANAARDKSTGDANANRDYANSLAAIQNQVNQAALDAPSEFGEFAYGDTSTTRPLALVANVVTQSKDAIERTGDQFLRYGYAYRKYVDFTGFNLMPKFTFWKCSDVWVRGLDMADEHMDEIRFFLMGGVTVWRRPEHIGNTSIYDNV